MGSCLGCSFRCRLFWGRGISYHFSHDVAMWFLQVSVIGIQSLQNGKSATFIKFLAYFIEDMHMQVDTNCITVLLYSFFQILHHLPTYSELPVGLKYAESQDISMALFLEWLHSGRISTDCDIIIVAVLWKFGILHSNFHVKWCTVLNWQCIQVYFSK